MNDKVRGDASSGGGNDIATAKWQSLIEDMNAVHNALAAAHRWGLYSYKTQPVLDDINLRGEGADVSHHELVFHDLAGSAQAMFILRTVDALASSPKDANKGKFMENLEKSPSKRDPERESWNLEYLLYSAYHNCPDLTEEQKGKIKGLYETLFDIVSSNEFSSAAKDRNKLIAHLGRDISIHQDGTQDNSSSLRLYALMSCLEKGWQIFADLADTIGAAILSHGNLKSVLRLDAISISEGLDPFLDSYKQKFAEARGPLKRVSAQPSHANTLLNEKITWQADDGSLYHALRKPDGFWLTYQKFAIGGVQARRIAAITPNAIGAKIAAEKDHVSTERLIGRSVELEAVSLQEAFRVDLGNLDEHNVCEQAFIFVAADKEWDGYIGLNTPVQIVIVASEQNCEEHANKIGEQFIALMNSFGISAYLKVSTSKEFEKSVPLAPGMFAPEDRQGKFLHTFCFAGDPAAVPDEVEIPNISPYLEKELGVVG